MVKSGYLKRYRHPVTVMRFAVILHIYLPSRIVAFILFMLFRDTITHKTVCEWTRKFANGASLPYAPPDGILICHVDEKYVKVGGIWHYWWSIKDALGNLIDSIVTPSRDFDSAKKLFQNSRRKIGRSVDVLVRDGLTAYDKATKFLGRKCESVVAGIRGKPIIVDGSFYWITNNPAESLNSEIDFYLGRFRNNFQNIESANMFARLFMLQKCLKKKLTEGKLLEASSMLSQAITL